MSTIVFQAVGGLKPRRTAFNLSYDKTFTCELGKLIPVMCDEVVPGDFFNISNAFHVRFMPIVAPLMHSMSVYVHYYFVPYRLLWGGIVPKTGKEYNGVPVETGSWEQFITGGVDGRTGFPTNDPAMPPPVWVPTTVDVTQPHGLWDYLGFPMGQGITHINNAPLDFPRRAYNFIYNEYYRDQSLTNAVPWTNSTILNRAWRKDYFTSALPFLQRGVAPAMPFTLQSGGTPDDTVLVRTVLGATGVIADTALQIDPNGQAVNTAGNQVGKTLRHPSGNQLTNNAQLAIKTTDFRTSSFDVSDLRLAFQIQKWLERNARAGARYVEFLRAHFGVFPRDDRLQRPEYIGGTYEPVQIGEVPQTSTSQTGGLLDDIQGKQGNIASTAQANSQQHATKYHVKEFGLIMGIMSIMPKATYYQGINRQWLRRTKYDYFFPEFANLSEQEIFRGEIYMTSDGVLPRQVFGFQGRYDEMRYKPSMVAGLLRPNMGDLYFSAMSLVRDLSEEGLSPEQSTFELSGSFITCNPSKRYLAVPSEPTCVCTFANVIKAYRPMPFLAEPGLIDHH